MTVKHLSEIIYEYIENSDQIFFSLGDPIDRNQNSQTKTKLDILSDLEELIEENVRK